jgi:hypothetical protein
MTKNEERRLIPGRRSEDATNDSLLQHLADKFETLEAERRERNRRMTDRLRASRRSPDPSLDASPNPR